MPVTALCLVLAAALLHALWNVVAKQAGGDNRFSFMLTASMILLWSPLGVWAGWDEVPRWGWQAWAAVAVSGLANLAYLHVLLRGYAASDLTVVYPVARGTGPLIAALGALLLFDETLGIAGAIGLVLVCGGVFLVAGGPGLWRQAHDPARRQRVLAGVGWGTATGLCICAYTLVDGYAVKVLLVHPLLVMYFGNLLRLPFLVPVVLRDRPGFVQALRLQWRHALVVATIAPLGYLLVLYAMKLAPLSHVAPAREVSMLFAALIGGRLLGEGDRGLRLAGAACIALGVAGLAFG